MKVIKELETKNSRQLRHHFVQGRDSRFYKVLTFQLYDRQPPREFPNFEVNIQKVFENGSFKELVVPYLKRFFKKEEALIHHDSLLEKMDELLNLEEPKTHKKEEKAADH